MRTYNSGWYQTKFPGDTNPDKGGCLFIFLFGLYLFTAGPLINIYHINPWFVHLFWIGILTISFIFSIKK